jgi:hypothetical protein
LQTCRNRDLESLAGAATVPEPMQGAVCVGARQLKSRKAAAVSLCSKTRRRDSSKCRGGGGLRMVVRRVSGRTKVERLRSLTAGREQAGARLRLPSPATANRITARHGSRAPWNFALTISRSPSALVHLYCDQPPSSDSTSSAPIHRYPDLNETGRNCHDGGRRVHPVAFQVAASTGWRRPSRSSAPRD